MKKLILILLVGMVACSKNEAEQTSTQDEQAPIAVAENMTVKEFLHDIDTAKKTHKECVLLGDSRKNIPKCINADRAVYLQFARGDLGKCYKQEVNHGCIDAYLEKHKQ
jgi:hypothetical protein